MEKRGFLESIKKRGLSIAPFTAMLLFQACVDIPSGKARSVDQGIDMDVVDMRDMPIDMDDMNTQDLDMPRDMSDMATSDLSEDMSIDMTDMDITEEDMGTDMDIPDMMDMNVPTDMDVICTTQMLTQRDQILGVLDDHEAIMSSNGSMFNGNKYGNAKFTLEFGAECANQVSNYQIATVNGVNVAKATNQNCEASYSFTNGPIGNRDNTQTTTRTFTNGGTFVANFGGSTGGVIPAGQPSLTVELDANGQLKVNGQPSTLCTSYENEIITKINN